jgi:predicted Zn-dependent protease
VSAPISLLEPARYLSRAEAEVLAKRALSLVTAEATRVTLQSGSRGNTRFALNQISTAGDDFNTTVTVRSLFGKRAATVTTNKLDDAGLRYAVETSERLAKLAPEDPEEMGELSPQQYAESRAWSDATAALDPAGRANAVSAITRAARGAELHATGYLETNAGSFAVANSKGLGQRSPRRCELLTAMARDGQVPHTTIGRASNPPTLVRGRSRRRASRKIRSRSSPDDILSCSSPQRSEISSRISGSR